MCVCIYKIIQGSEDEKYIIIMLPIRTKFIEYFLCLRLYAEWLLWTFYLIYSLDLKVTCSIVNYYHEHFENEKIEPQAA